MTSTPLAAVHHGLGAKLVDFAGWQMPVQYSGVLDEHLAVRSACGVFDVSHLGRFRLDGDDAVGLARSELCNDIDRIADGRAQYTMALNDDGGVVDDIIVWRVGPGSVWVMPNGVNHDRIRDRFASRGGAIEISDHRLDTALLAVQGPTAPDVLQRVLADVPGRFRCVTTETHDGIPVSAAGTGYTGERGAELIVPATAAEAVWTAIVDAGAVPCGLGARDTLRLEMGYPLWGQDLDEATSPLEAGLGWVVDWDHEFVGRDALARRRDGGGERVMVGFRTASRRIARSGSRLRSGSLSGVVTSGNFSPVLEEGIGLGYLDARPEEPLEVEIRGSWHPVEVTRPPFIEVG